MEHTFDLKTYLTEGVEHVVFDILKATAKNPKESAFMAKFALHAKASAAVRTENAFMPPFLIASITSVCNMHCRGCYVRGIGSCNDEATQEEMMCADEWRSVFAQARDLGICFIIIVGGEPFLRSDVLQVTAEFPEILFPVFTNGTLMSEQYLSLFDKNRNLVPILSLEGGQAATDQRRGNGIYQNLLAWMEQMKNRGLLFGTSITVTKENIKDITAPDFIGEMNRHGCKAMFFVDYVSTSEEDKDLEPADEEREYMKNAMAECRSAHKDMIFISFPGDEKASGGCLAAGRGFFHINAYGGAEPCPFSPYSDVNVKEVPLKKVVESKLFRGLHESGLLLEDHPGGCVLAERDAQVRALMNT
ncbi:MAG: radical SAM protein [Victivallales bacterium]|nr:radical SAM protein [Victivallales bacterium]